MAAEIRLNSFSTIYGRLKQLDKKIKYNVSLDFFLYLFDSEMFLSWK